VETQARSKGEHNEIGRNSETDFDGSTVFIRGNKEQI
jgi:hypothetical protein